MADQDNGTTIDTQPTGNGEDTAPAAGLISQYVKDLSFENLNAPAIFQNPNPPAIDVQFNIGTAQVGEEVHEVLLKIDVKAEAEGQTAFIVDLTYAGLFGLRNVPADAIQPFLLGEAPRLLFPFARRVLADCVRDGGFPPLLLEPIDFGRLVVDDDGALRILTAASKFDGITLPPDKFIVHTPQSVSGHPMRGGLLRVTATAYLAKHFAIKDWLIFAEVFGMPVRIARYQPNATRAEKRELLEMLKQLGADATGIFSKAVDIEIKQTRLPGETNLYENLCLYFDREISKAWLGQTLTTDVVRQRAGAGAAIVHNRVRHDLRDDDLRRESHTLRRDLLTTLTRLEFGPDVPVPYFRRIPDQTLEPETLSRVLGVAVNELGAKVPAGWAHAALGLPEAEEGQGVLPGATG